MKSIWQDTVGRTLREVNGTEYEDREEVDNYIPVGNYGLIVHE